MYRKPKNARCYNILLFLVANHHHVWGLLMTIIRAFQRILMKDKVSC